MDTPPPTAPAPAPVSAANEDRTVALLSYLTLIGFVVAIIIHSSKKTQLGAFHLRQALGLFITGMACGFANFILIFIPILGWLAMLVIWVSLLVFLIMGFISAVQGTMKPVPILGAKYQQWFANAFQ